LPKGWTEASRSSFWASLTGEGTEHKVTACIAKMDGNVDDPGAFCAALADRENPGWRKTKAEKHAESAPAPIPAKGTGDPIKFKVKLGILDSSMHGDKPDPNAPAAGEISKVWVDKDTLCGTKVLHRKNWEKICRTGIILGTSIHSVISTSSSELRSST